MRHFFVLSLLLLFIAAGCGTSGSDPWQLGGTGGFNDPGGSGGSGGSGGIAGSGGGGGEGGEGGIGGSGGEGPTAEEICTLWRDGRSENEEDPWTPGTDACDPGTPSDVAVEDTLRRINLYRALAGLPPVTVDPGQHAKSQACAVIMDANNELSHVPPTTWDCWTQDGADGAASSNISLGYKSPGKAIDGQMRDAPVVSVGHRRWLLGFFLGRVGIGFTSRATCIGVFDDTGVTDTPWTAYPPAGPAPFGMLVDPRSRPVPWSFHPADGIKGAEVAMERLPSEEPVEIDTWIPETGWMIPDAIVWQPPPVEAGESYRITVTRPNKEPITYDVELVDCDPEG